MYLYYTKYSDNNKAWLIIFSREDNMDVNKGWKWTEIDTDYWSEPSEEIYYLCSRWEDMGFMRFLDLGSGIGRHSLHMAAQGFDVTAYDLSESGHAILGEKAAKLGLSIQTVKGNNEILPFNHSSFDCLLAYHSLYHSDSVGMGRIVSEMHRVLGSGGEAYLTLISKSHPDYLRDDLEKLDANTVMKPEEDGSIIPHYFVRYEEIEKLLHPFEIIKVKHVEDFFSGKSSWHYFVHIRKP
jgi:ubiquinone/menaquinone biosynthesis C-methylase UbiE